MQRLEARLAVLEARHAPVAGGVSPTERASLSASVQALLKGDGIDRLRPMLARFDTGTETDDDRAMLAGLPPCHLTPHELARMLDSLWHEV